MRAARAAVVWAAAEAERAVFRLPQLTRNLAAALRDAVHQNPAVRVSALGDLAKHADEHRSEIEPVLEAALRDPIPRVRAAAAEALGDVEAKEAIAALLVAVDDDDGLVRERAITALGELGDPRATGRLERALGDPRPEVRFQATIAYPRVAVSRDDAIARLVEATKDEDELVSRIAFRMAEEVADKHGEGIDGRIVERAVECLTHPSLRVRGVAAILAASAEDSRADDAIVAMIDGSLPTPEAEDMTAAIELAGERRIERATPGLERRAFGGLLGLRRDPFAWHARTALAAMGHRRASDEIESDLRSMSFHKRTLAVAAAGRAKLQRARPRLLEMKGHPSKAPAAAVDGALAQLEAASKATGVNARVVSPDAP